LYVYYLRDQFKPYTYGREWIMVERMFGASLAAVPWSWLTHHSEENYQIDRVWAASTAPGRCGMTAGTRWTILRPNERSCFEGIFGIASSNEPARAVEGARCCGSGCGAVEVAPEGRGGYA
jgi:hypothetical protein